MSNPNSQDKTQTGPCSFASIETDSGLWPVIIRWGQGHDPTPAQRQRLKNWPVEQQIWHEADLTQRATLLQRLSQRWAQGTETLPITGPWQDWIVPLWSCWLPLALQIDQAQKQLNAVYVQGILGGQGTGKSTLASMLQLLLALLGQQSVSLSIDDLYLTYPERQALTQRDSRLVWRGPPGTHDVQLGLRTLQALTTPVPTERTQSNIAVPRFDKSMHGGQGDRTHPLMVSQPTVVLFEGWFVGAQPLAEDVINADNFVFPPPITRAADRQFAKDCNHRLREYLPLWDYLHSLVVLQPEDYRLSLQWRQDAERKMIATGRSGLSPDEIVRFVTYFWKALHPELFITPLTLDNQKELAGMNSFKTSLVANIGFAHRIESLRLPGR